MTLLEQALSEALVEVFLRSMGEDVSVVFEGGSPVPSAGDVVVHMDVADGAVGWISVWAGVETASSIVAAMLGFPDAPPDAEMVADGMREILNVVAGGAKARLVGTPWHFRLSLPARGPEPRADEGGGGEQVALRAETGAGPVSMRAAVVPAGS